MSEKLENTVKFIDDCAYINLEESVYSSDDIFLAQSLISNDCVMKLEKPDNKFRIQLTLTNKNINAEDLVKRFLFHISEQHVRSILLKESGYVRDLIVEQAFKPIENLRSRINEL